MTIFDVESWGAKRVKEYQVYYNLVAQEQDDISKGIPPGRTRQLVKEMEERDAKRRQQLELQLEGKT